MLKQMAILVLILGLIFSGLAAATTRSCYAQYFVTVRIPDGLGGWEYIGPDEPIYYPEFRGQATTGGSTIASHPDFARTAARNNLDDCIDAFDDRDREASYCSGAHQIYGYPFPDGLIPQITNDLCSRYPGHDSFRINLHVAFSGNTGCNPRNEWNTFVARDYQIDCPRYVGQLRYSAPSLMPGHVRIVQPGDSAIRIVQPSDLAIHSHEDEE